MVSDSVLVDRLREILKVSDLETTTAGSVRRKLEEEFGVDLNDRKAFIRDQIDLFLRTHVEETPNDDVQEVEQEQETENVKEEENDDSCSQEEENESDTGTKEKSQYVFLCNFLTFSFYSTYLLDPFFMMGRNHLILFASARI